MFTANATLPPRLAYTGWPWVAAMRMPLLSLSADEYRPITAPSSGHAQPRRVTLVDGATGLPLLAVVVAGRLVVFAPPKRMVWPTFTA
ncbi:hypothetical protein D3C77_712520 [compost metagenome]